MGFIASLLNETCVYWAPATRNAYGQETYADPVELSCRWEDGERLVVDRKTSQETLMTTTVFFSQAVVTEGMLCYGELADIEDDSSPQDNDAREIRYIGRIPSVDATEFLYEAVMI